MARGESHHDVLILGAGVIGLSLAWRLALRGANVCLVDRGEPGRGASWAGAGMVPAGPATDRFESATTMERLAGLSDRLHEQWSRQLLEETGVDNGYRRCGALYLAGQLANDLSAEVELAHRTCRWSALGIRHRQLDAGEMASLEPALDIEFASSSPNALVPDEAQFRNPRHVRALLAACEQRGVTILSHVNVRGINVDGETAISAVADACSLRADQFCITAGCWSSGLAASLGATLPVRPVRGQIALLVGRPGLLQRNINVGSRYLVPRDDGRVLIGSTEEETGFDPRTTAEGVGGLLQFASQLAPPLGRLPVERSWAGLRPATADGLPYLGRMPNLENVWTATGHFRAGLQLSPATAEVTAQLICGERPSIDVAELSPSRACHAATT